MDQINHNKENYSVKILKNVLTSIPLIINGDFNMTEKHKKTEQIVQNLYYIITAMTS